MSERYPGLRVVGTYTPPFRPLTPQEEDDLARRIDAVSPDLLWVGLSTPKQELWMREHVGHLNARVMLGVGAAFDVHAGLRWDMHPVIRGSGFEWLVRLAAEPRRLWRRYLRNNPAFVWRILVQRPRALKSDRVF
jgi:N-acetylglucosaminyldiphosphoundecaprenol N-acetyl-beta-D-mannosaminyltransferase